MVLVTLVTFKSMRSFWARGKFIGGSVRRIQLSVCNDLTGGESRLYRAYVVNFTSIEVSLTPVELRPGNEGTTLWILLEM